MSEVCPNGHPLSDGLCVAYKCERLAGGEPTPKPVVFPAHHTLTKLLRTKPPTAQETFSRELQRTRKMIGLKQIHIATEMEITQSTYSKWERSRLLPNPIQMGELVGIFANRGVASTSSAFTNGASFEGKNLYPTRLELQLDDLEQAYKAALASTLTR